MERQIEDNGNVRQNTTYSVNNIYLNGVRIAALTAEGETRFYLTDQVDSVSMVLSEQGKPLTAFEYLPYGETWLERVQGGLKEKHNPKYNSQELDTETDFYYYNARYYDPEVSRFVTADTVIDGEHASQGWNRYMYVKGNPIRYSDPTGHRGSDNGNSFTGLAELANQFWNKVSGNSGEGGKSTSSQPQNNKETVASLESKINKATGNKINLNEGFHIIMLENNTKIPFLTTGRDDFKGSSYIIDKGEIINKSIGTSKASVTPSSESKEKAVNNLYDTAVNAGNNLKEGSYKLSGDLKERRLSIENGGVVPSTGGSGTQMYLLAHDRAASKRWSGGIGCQIIEGFSKFASEYSKKNESTINGQYHLINMGK